MITFDFMQNIPFPHIPISDLFYIRQMWLYVFGIKAFMYEYDEITAKKKAGGREGEGREGDRGEGNGEGELETTTL